MIVPASGSCQSEDHLKGGGFPGAVGAQKSIDRSRRDLHIDRIYAADFAEAFGQMACFNEILCFHNAPFRKAYIRKRQIPFRFTEIEYKGNTLRSGEAYLTFTLRLDPDGFGREEKIV